MDHLGSGVKSKTVASLIAGPLQSSKLRAPEVASRAREHQEGMACGEYRFRNPHSL